MTRNSDITMDLHEREVIANNANVDWFHSVHHNGSTNNATDGSLVLYEETMAGAAWPGQTDIISDTMALLLSRAFNLRNIGGVGDYTFYGQASYLGVLNDLTMPGQLSEAFFTTTLREDALMRNDDYLKTEAEVLYISFLKQLNLELPSTGTVVGIIRDVFSGSLGINIVVTDLLEGRTTRVDTLGNGFFRLDSLSPGNHTLQFQSDRDTIEIDYELFAGRIRHVTLSMDTDSKPLFPKPSTPIIKSVTREGGDTVVRWYLNSAADADGYRLFFSSDGESWTANDDFSASETEFRLPGFPNQQSVYFSVAALNIEEITVESQRSNAYGIMLDDTLAPILVVDGFDRRTSWGGESHEFALMHGESIFSSKRNFETASNDAVIDGSVNLLDYRIVVWLSGDEGVADESFNSVEQSRVKAFLESGGMLFLSGSEIGYDLVERGSSTDRTFYRNYLKADYKLDDSEQLSVTGVPGEIFGAVTFGFGNTALGAAYVEDFPDAIEPIDGSRALLTYNNTNAGAGIIYEGVFGSSLMPGRLIYLPFPFEVIELSDMRDMVMTAALNEFGRILRVSDEELLPKSVYLLQNFPNPFNVSTMIRFELPNEEKLSLIIYDMLGREVVRLIENARMSGMVEQQWDGKNSSGNFVSSGIYVSVLIIENEVLSKKMTLLK
ncbi:MAG: N-acetylmuramoyl-L-alanine amidase [Candidatus Marinimicrobia bacterium]|nr:N-acetylmuramoyl-L-alanine amidase [Candidatus Neomarinimicrobiota bacterium]